MRTVAAAFAAVSEKRFDDLTPLISPEIDWHGVPEPDFGTPHCHGRATALERMRVGWLAGGAVSVEAFAEEGERVLARVRAPAAGGGAAGSPQRFVIAEVHDGQITEVRGYADEADAQAAMRAPALPDASLPGAPPAHGH